MKVPLKKPKMYLLLPAVFGLSCSNATLEDVNTLVGGNTDIPVEVLNIDGAVTQSMAVDYLSIINIVAGSNWDFAKVTLCNWKYNAGTRGLTGYVYEVLGFSTELSTADRKLVYEYLQKKWGHAF
jgi:hypothetical protein